MLPLLALTTLLTTASAATPSEAVSVTGGYHGDFLSHPGGYAGVRVPLAETGPWSFSVGADLGAYHHRRNHTGAFARGHLATRLTSSGGWLVEPRFTLGYLHTIVNGDGYWVVDERTDELHQVAPLGSANVVYGLGLGLGHTLKSGPTLVVRPEMLGRAPYNGFTLSQFSVQLGVEFPLGGAR